MLGLKEGGEPGGGSRLLLKPLLFFWEKQTRSVERHIRKMEFHISKVSWRPGVSGRGWVVCSGWASTR